MIRIMPICVTRCDNFSHSCAVDDALGGACDHAIVDGAAEALSSELVVVLAAVTSSFEEC